jgi:hypothetical protein
MRSTVIEETIGAIADAKDKEPKDLDVVLHDYIAADVIHQLASHSSNSWTLQFEIPNHTVTIKGGDAVLVDGVQTRTLS